jgi:hypothetical protein
MKLKLGLFALAALLLSAIVLAPMSAEAARKSNAVTFPVPDTSATVNGAAATLINATATITNFAVQNGQVVANGTLSGTLVDSAGNVLATLTNVAFSLPITTSQSSCTILTLDLGPLHLFLLGLTIDLSAIHLDITAQPGAGLLGDLLCAVDNLLNGGNLAALTNLLNSILSILSGV